MPRLPRFVKHPGPMRIFSVGHSTHPLATFVELLRRHAVDGLADIRTVPRSRKWPHFATDQLARSLPAAGIAYVHLAALGGWRSPAGDSPNGAWRNRSFRGYADHAMTGEFAEGLGELCELATARPTAMMCSESLWWRCHRRLVADRLTSTGWEVAHIGPDGRLTVHELPAFAVAGPGGLVTYPATEV